MKTLLNDIAKIDSGKSFRQRIEDDPDGTCAVIQMKDISNELLSITGTPHSIQSNEVKPNQLLRKGDILFMAKGNNNFAVLYEWDKPAVAASLFFIVRPNHDRVFPGYLFWFLNSPIAQSYFHERRLGASVGNIRKDALANLEIELPTMDLQRQIATLNKLTREEKKLTNQYLEKKELFMSNTMINLIK